MTEQELHEKRVAEAKRCTESVIAAQTVTALFVHVFGTHRTWLTGREYWPFGQYMFAAIALAAYLLFW